MPQRKPQQPLRSHEVTRVLKILRALARESKNTLAIYRELRNDVGFRNHHGFYRQLNFCLKNRLVELVKVTKKWGIPTKIYRLTDKGRDFMRLFSEREKFYG